MEPQILQASHPLYNFWITGNAATVPSRKQLKSLKFDKDTLDLMIESNFSPKVIAILIKGLYRLLLYAFQNMTKDLKNLLKELDNPKLPSNKTNQSKKVVRTRKAHAFQNQNNMLMHSDSYSGREHGRLHTHISRFPFLFQPSYSLFQGNPADINLPAQGHMHNYQHDREMTQDFGLMNRGNDIDFQEALNNNNFFPRNDAFGDERFPFGFDSKHFNQEDLHFNLPPDHPLSFTQKINKNFESFRMITPAKLKDKDLFDYYEEDGGSGEKDDVRFNLSNKEQVARSLNFEGHRPKRLVSLRQKKTSLKDLRKSLEQPYSDLSESLKELWMFAQGKNDNFEESLTNLSELWVQIQDQIEVKRHKDDSLPLESPVQQFSKDFSPRAVDFRFPNASNDISSGKKTGEYFKQDSDSKFGTIQEDTHEMTSTTQLFGFSELFNQPPTLSYEMSLQQYCNNKNAEEIKKNQSRKSLQLTKETTDVLTNLKEQSKSMKQLEFEYLTKKFKKEQKASYFYNTLILAGVGKITMKQKARETFGEISIVLN